MKLSGRTDPKNLIRRWMTMNSSSLLVHPRVRIRKQKNNNSQNQSNLFIKPVRHKLKHSLKFIIHKKWILRCLHQQKNIINPRVSL